MHTNNAALQGASSLSPCHTDLITGGGRRPRESVVGDSACGQYLHTVGSCAPVGVQLWKSSPEAGFGKLLENLQCWADMGVHVDDFVSISHYFPPLLAFSKCVVDRLLSGILATLKLDVKQTFKQKAGPARGGSGFPLFILRVVGG